MSFTNRQQSGIPITAKDEGITITTNMTTIDFVGSGRSATALDGVVTDNVSGGGAGTWGSITGTLSDQTDLQNELDILTLSLAGKSDVGHTHTLLQLTDVPDTLYTGVAGYLLKVNATENGIDTYDIKSLETEINDLQTDLSGKMVTSVYDPTNVSADAFDRANHTGTQDSGTISDFAEAAQDAVGSILQNSATIDIVYDDPTGSITASVNDGSISSDKMANSNGFSVFGKADTGAGQGQEIDIIASSVLGRGPTGNVVALSAGAGITITDTEIQATGGGGGIIEELAIAYAVTL